MTECSISSCLNKPKTRGMCNKHYLKWWKHGSATAGMEYAKRGSGTVSPSNGYRLVYINGKQRLEHVVVAEKALGRPLPLGVQVHHINGIKTDNTPSNLVVCQSESYHKLLHRRQEAFEATGNPDMRRCRYCGKWDVRENLYSPPGKDTGFHRQCRQLNRKD